MAWLFCHVALVLLESAQMRQTKSFTRILPFDPDFVLRTRLVAWLITEGADPAIFHSDAISREVVQFTSEMTTLSNRTIFTYHEIISFLLEGHAIFAETHQVTNAQTAYGLAMIAAIRLKLPELERDLGWTK